jgi:hypothetical protein
MQVSCITHVLHLSAKALLESPQISFDDERVAAEGYKGEDLSCLQGMGATIGKVFVVP